MRNLGHGILSEHVQHVLAVVIVDIIEDELLQKYTIIRLDNTTTSKQYNISFKKMSCFMTNINNRK